MKNKHIVAVALAALALVAGSFSTVHASKPSTSDELRVTRYLTKNTTSPIFTLSTDSLVATAYEGSVKRLMVVDFVLYTSTAGAVAEDFQIQFTDDNANIIFAANQTVLANTTETMFISFPGGFPMFNARSTATTAIYKNREDPCATAAYLAASSTAAGTFTIGYHMEAVGDRLP